MFNNFLLFDDINPIQTTIKGVTMYAKDKKKALILQAAFDLFLNQGYEATSIRMISKKAQVEAPTLYHYFGSKKGLFFALIDTLLLKYQDLFKEMIQALALNPEDKLYEFFKFSVHYTRTYPDETKFYLRFKLFPPKDLKETIQKHMYETNEAKKNFYMNHLIACKDPHFSKENVYQRYVNFIDTCTFNLIFSNWQPSEAELHRSWVLFFTHQIRQSPERGV